MAVPVRIPEQWSPTWFRQFYVEVLARVPQLELAAHVANPDAHERLKALPIGSIYSSTINANPATMLGYGTWNAFGTGTDTVAGSTVYVWERTA